MSGAIVGANNAQMREVRIAPPEAKFLRMIASRGGEIPWDWSHASLNGKNGELAKGMVASLINQQLILEREYAKHALDPNPRLVLRLTDAGRSVVERLEAMDVEAKKAPQIITSPT